MDWIKLGVAGIRENTSSEVGKQPLSLLQRTLKQDLTQSLPVCLEAGIDVSILFIRLIKDCLL